MRKSRLAIGLTVLFVLGLGAAAVYKAKWSANAAPTAILFLNKETVDRSDFTRFQNNQAQMIKTHLVLSGALRDPLASDLAVLKSQEAPVAWLAERLQVTFPPDSAVMRISLIGMAPQDGVPILNAVVHSYVREVTDHEKDRASQRIEKLRRIVAEYGQSYQEKWSQLESVKKEADGSDAALATFKRQRALRRMDALDNELLQVQSELRKLRIELGVQEAKGKETADTKLRVAVLLERIHMQERLKTELSKEIEDLEKEIQQQPKKGLILSDTEQARVEMAEQMAIYQKLTAELKNLELQQRLASPSVALLEAAH